MQVFNFIVLDASFKPLLMTRLPLTVLTSRNKNLCSWKRLSKT